MIHEQQMAYLVTVLKRGAVLVLSLSLAALVCETTSDLVKGHLGPIEAPILLSSQKLVDLLGESAVLGEI